MGTQSYKTLGILEKVCNFRETRVLEKLCNLERLDILKRLKFLSEFLRTFKLLKVIKSFKVGLLKFYIVLLV